MRTSAQLGWSHYVLLCQVAEPKERAALTVQANKGGWTTPALRERVRALNAARETSSGAPSAGDRHDSERTKPVRKLLTPKRGSAGRYRAVAQNGGLGIDVGFKISLPLSPAQARCRTVGEIVGVDADGNIRAVDDGQSSDRFTYQASVRRVIDGDTLEIALTLPHVVLREKLRLRDLDCPELDTAEGKTAKRVVDGLVAAAKTVTIYTTKPDKYDRCLADVFIRIGDGTKIFLNNHLLENDLAERKDAWEFSDWEKMASL